MNTQNKLPFNLNPPFAVLGYGVEGQYAVEFLMNHNLGPITVFDQRSLADLPEGMHFKRVEKDWGDLTQFGTIFRSPGVHYHLPEIQEARELGIQITSLTELTFEYARNHTTAITGSNGKTTTTNLTAHLLKQKYGDRMILGGNDHVPVLQQVLNKPIEPVLMEVSSFQFADLKISPHIAAILNITPNHLDWHTDLLDYVNAKRNLMLHQKANDWVVLNANDENLVKFGAKAKGEVVWVGEKKGDHWALWESEQLNIHLNEQDFQVIHRSDIPLKTHNDNIAFVSALALIHGLTVDQIREGLKSFKGTEHRLEYLEEKEGVKFYNDSACTTPESTQVALKQFEAGKLILLLGGSSKNSEFDYLALDIKKHGARVLLYGQEAKRIEEALIDQGAEELILNTDYKMDFELIVKKAFELAQAGDSIVLSPACASFDMFKNSKKRGLIFKEIVRKII